MEMVEAEALETAICSCKMTHSPRAHGFDIFVIFDTNNRLKGGRYAIPREIWDPNPPTDCKLQTGTYVVFYENYVICGRDQSFGLTPCNFVEITNYNSYFFRCWGDGWVGGVSATCVGPHRRTKTCHLTSVAREGHIAITICMPRLYGEVWRKISVGA